MLFVEKMSNWNQANKAFFKQKGVEKDKACKVVSMTTRVTHNGCQAEEEVDMPYCEGSCNTFTK